MAIRTIYDTHSMLHSYTHAQLSRYTHAWLHSHTEEIGSLGKIVNDGKLLAYVLDAATLRIKDVLEFETFEFQTDSEFSNKSKIITSRLPLIDHDDFVICKSAGGTVFVGICDNYNTDSDSAAYTITLRQKENLFDRFIFIRNEALISSAGIEDFIAQAIADNWISSGDSMLDRSYMHVNAVTHTPVAAKVSTTVSLTDGAYNLKTYLGNALEYYGVYVDFSFTEGRLDLSVYKDQATAVNIDVSFSDIANYTETYSVDALTKINVQWGHTTESSDEVTEVTEHTYYLLANRTVTTDGTDPNRAKGSTRSVYIEAETEAEMRQEVTNRFSSNNYTHKIVFTLFMDSKIYDYRDFYVGRQANIKTKTGIRSSLVTAHGITSESRFVQISFGKLKVTLIEKIRSLE